MRISLVGLADCHYASLYSSPQVFLYSNSQLSLGPMMGTCFLHRIIFLLGFWLSPPGDRPLVLFSLMSLFLLRFSLASLPGVCPFCFHFCPNHLSYAFIRSSWHQSHTSLNDRKKISDQKNQREFSFPP